MPLIFLAKVLNHRCFTAQKMKFPIKGFFSKCDQIRRKLQIWSHLLNKFLMENFVFWAAFDRVVNTLMTAILNLILNQLILPLFHHPNPHLR